MIKSKKLLPKIGVAGCRVTTRDLIHDLMDLGYPIEALLTIPPKIAKQQYHISGYNVYYGNSTKDYDVTLDVGNWTRVKIADLEDDETYYFAVTAYNTDGNESDYSNEACMNCESPSTTASSGGDGGGGGCFIATVAYTFSRAK